MWSTSGNWMTRDNLRCTSGIWMTLCIIKSDVYQWYLDDYRDNLRSTSGIWMTLGKV